MSEEKLDYDYIIIGSGFGGSVSAHRLTQKGYKVLVLEKGKIIEQGNHQELMEKRATYYNLVQMQQMQ